MSNAAKESVKETTSGGEAAKKEEPTVEAKAVTDASATSKAPTITIQEAQEVDPDLPLDITNSPNVSNDAKSNAVEETQVHAANRGTPKFAILLSWNLGYFKTSVGLLRLLFMLCCILSLVCLANAGTDDVDVLELSAFSRIRFHIFCCILVLLVSTLIYILEITSLKNSMPVNWYLADIFSTFILGTLCIVTSTLLLHAGRVTFDDDDDEDGDTDDDDDDIKDILHNTDDLMPGWSRALLALAAVFGYFATLVSVFLIVFKCFNRQGSSTSTKHPTQVQEEIMMSGTS